jgi:hypothetical protein
MRRVQLAPTDPFRKIGNVDWVCDCPSEDGSWYLRRCTHECTMARYSAQRIFDNAENARREKIPEIVLIADIIEGALSGQYGRDTALDIAEEILMARKKVLDII